MKKFVLSSLSFFLPAIAFAQSSSQTIDSAQSLAKWVIDFINNIAVPLIFALSFIFFIFGVFRYFIAGAANEEKRKSGRDIMIYGIIGIVVMICVWGIVHILTGTIRLDQSVPTQGNGLPQAAQTR